MHAPTAPAWRRLATTLLALAFPLAASAGGGKASTQELDRAIDGLAATIADTARALREDPAYRDAEQRAEGVAYWAQMIIRTLEEDLIQDPDYPLFRVVDFRIREGGDNPDQRYLAAPVTGGQTYHLWGRRHGERRLEIQVYAGVPWSEAGGRVVAVLTDEDLRTDEDGHFEAWLGGSQREHNWLPNPAKSSFVMVRQIYADWPARAGEVHIDRVGYEGKLKPAPDEADMARRLRRASENLSDLVPLWPRFGRERFAQEEPNTLSPPFETAAAGGVVGRWMSLGKFRLPPDKALVLTLWPASGNYQGVQLTDLWTSSLEYANRQTSLSADQSHQGADGALRYVISHDDPGVQNWLDTTGLQAGYLLLRYDGTGGTPIPREHWPRLQLIDRDAIASTLPNDTPVFSEAQRRDAIAERRRHVQIRFHR